MIERIGRTRSHVEQLRLLMPRRSRWVYRSIRRPCSIALGLILFGAGIASCASSPFAEEVERSLAADPRYTDEAVPEEPAPSSSSSFSAQPMELAEQLGQQWNAPSADRLGQALDILPPRPPQDFVDLDDAPEDLRPYLLDLAELGVLVSETVDAADAADPSDPPTQNLLRPNQPVTRREFARWLVAANNQLFSDRPSYRIRLATDTAQPAFQDVPPSDRDFAAIQGLAEAGLLPSPLSGNTTTVNFRPDEPLTRETALRWKVPLDLRQPLPTASVEAVSQTWGFQDAGQIDPDALRAVLADYQNGERASTRRAFGFTTLLQPKRSVTRAEAAAVLWFFGYQGDGRSAQDVLRTRTQMGRDESLGDEDINESDRSVDPDDNPSDDNTSTDDHERSAPAN
ncbi:MAG: S-layer homology domain-containing protein [Leptolyngbya sp. DLM2.Bin15]|nr:MAG: S-layer homology domain-containing protein [Leptolyngbya sp. DLM2.Bin15]